VTDTENRSSEGRSILVVDDEEEVTDLLQTVLGRYGYSVDIARSGTSALDLARSRRFDVVILDFRMPEMDGIETFRQLKAMGQEPAAIILTAHGDIRSAREAMELGAHDYITKPFLIDVVRESILDALEIDHASLGTARRCGTGAA
jgi:DNA-binding NtrC family response regulator